MILQEHVTKGLVTLCVGAPHVSHHLAKFCGHSHCGSRDMMFIVVKEQDSTCFRLNPPLLFVSKAFDLR